MLGQVVVEGREYTILNVVAKKTHYKITHLRQLARDGKISTVQLAQSWYVDIQSVQAYQAEKPQRKPCAEPGRRQRQ